MSAPKNNLKQIFTSGREQSVNALVSDIVKKYEAYLVSGRDKFEYSYKWTEPGYFMSPYHMIFGNNTDATAVADTNVINGWVDEPERKVFMLEVVNALEKIGIYTINNSCCYETQPAGVIKHMIINITVSLIKPPTISNSCNYRD